MALLEVKGLKTYFSTRLGVVKAVDGISFSIDGGETLGLVGESGCGKSVTGLSILQLVPEPAGRIIAGEILFNGENLLGKSPKEMNKFRGRYLSMILQDPMTSLNPVFSIGSQVTEALHIHQGLKGSSLWQKGKRMLELVRIPSPETRMRNYPHQFSGGMRQRVVGAIALSCQPQVLIADEPTTSLDITVQAQYLSLLKEIQQQQGQAMIFITHDFGIVAQMCSHVAVMYAGRIVETGGVRDLFNHPAHPYTRALMRSVPSVETKVERLFSIPGEPPRLYQLAPSCSFISRCTEKTARCEKAAFPPEVSTTNNHLVSCWKYV